MIIRYHFIRFCAVNISEYRIERLKGNPLSYSIDADQYDGVNLNIPIGQAYDGGFDGDFEQIVVDGMIL